MKLLCTGDLHLGRRSSRLPSHLDGRTHSCAGCWDQVVALALEESVDVVALSGDLVDRDNRFYEAVGPLESGLRRLADAGIEIVAVAGNHDHDVLPRLVDALGPEAFRLLGRGGVWERATVRRGGRVLHIDGWSFPEPYVADSPVAAYALPVPDDGPVLGLLHADLDRPGSPYAPVSMVELRARPVDFWLLGHVHSPALHEGRGLTPVLYPGSPQAMDPGETGAHGVWIVELASGPTFGARFVPLSTVRYDEVVVDVTGAEGTDEVDARVVDAVRSHLASVEGSDSGVLRCVSCRLRVVGATPVHRRLAAHLESFVRDLELSVGGVTAQVERVHVETRPTRDLAGLARGRDPVAVVARLLGALEADALGPEEAALLRDAERAAAEVRRARAYAGLRVGPAGASNGARFRGGRGAGPGMPSTAERSGDPAAADAVRDALERQATLLLDALLAQKEDA